eukprot:scaffold5650_cov121-Cylindrotheca_fusiformis.AAC.4
MFLSVDGPCFVRVRVFCCCCDSKVKAPRADRRVVISAGRHISGRSHKTTSTSNSGDILLHFCCFFEIMGAWVPVSLRRDDPVEVDPVRDDY